MDADIGSATDRVGITEALGACATPDLYRHNPFRLSGLPVDATSRQLRRRSGELAAAERLGAPPSIPAGPLAPAVAPRSEEVAEALHRLRDPVHRLLAELFWLWPVPGGGVGGTSMTQARARWKTLLSGDSRDRAIGLHNRAVAVHLAALEREDASDRPKGRWPAVYRHWKLVEQDDAVWAWLRERVTEIADPRLRASHVDLIRAGLADVLLRGHTRLMVAKLTEPGIGRDMATRIADRQRNAMYGSGLPSTSVDRALADAVAPQVSRLRRVAERAGHRPGGSHAWEVGVELLKEFDGADLTVLRAALPNDHPVSGGVRDELAGALRICVVGEMNSKKVQVAKDLRWAIKSLDRAYPIAHGPAVKEQIARDVATLVINLVLTLCNTAYRDAEQQPLNARSRQKTLFDEVAPLLSRTRKQLPERYPELCDEVAATGFAMLAQYANHSPNPVGLSAALQSVHDTAHDRKLRGDIREVKDLVSNDLVSLHGRLPAPGRPAPTPAAPTRRSATGGLCVLCHRSATNEREISLARFTVGELQRRDVWVRCCEYCRYVRIGVGGHAFWRDASAAVGITLGVLVAYRDDWTFEAFQMPLIALAGLFLTFSYTAFRRRRRLKRIQRLTTVQQLLREGWVLLV